MCRSEAGLDGPSSSQHCSGEEKASKEWPLSHGDKSDGQQDAPRLSSDPPSPFLVVDSLHAPESQWTAVLGVGGMSCSSCVATITAAIQAKPWVRSVDVSLMTSAAMITFEGREHLDAIVETIEDIGFEAAVQEVKEVGPPPKHAPLQESDLWRATYTIGGMTCSACVGNITRTLDQVDWITAVDVNLLSNSASIIFSDRSRASLIREMIEEIGYEASLETVEQLDQPSPQDDRREVALWVQGMHCEHCPERIRRGLLDAFGGKVEVAQLPSRKTPILKISYVPNPPSFTVRHIIHVAATDPAFTITFHHPPTLEERSRAMHVQERRRILRRVLLCVITAIPVFLIGIVFMSLVSPHNPIRRYLMHPLWLGAVSRAQWALFILATPVYFFAADVFHDRALKEVRALWRRRSPTPVLQRFYRFGSMNMLMSLGTTIAYFASVAEVAITASRGKYEASKVNQATYFDSVVFLTMFLLLGRLLEAYSKSKTGDAVAALGKLRPSEAILINLDGSEDRPGEADTAHNMSRVKVDMLEIGDVVRVLQGGSPPMDGVIVAGQTKFDESSLTGESRLVAKSVGRDVFSGTVNKGSAVAVRISSVSGTSMLDQIVKVVRDGQTRRAPIERVADIITSHFVPAVTLFAILTWVVWLALGTSGALPRDYLDSTTGGWPTWSLQFAIAVFVIACPCGIGLAAPTALFVGGGLAAQHGILAKGGGEAFQEASQLDCVIFDKTGTLTHGAEPAVTDYECISSDSEFTMLGMARALEECSSHPVAKAIVAFCSSKEAKQCQPTQTDEIPGKGVRGSFAGMTNNGTLTDVLIGNEALLGDHGVHLPGQMRATLEAWKSQGKSIVLLGARTSTGEVSAPSTGSGQGDDWRLMAIFAVSDALRVEAAAVVRAIQQRGIHVWMISGDNPTTASAVARMVGIQPENVIAGVLPEQKAEKIKYLQKSLATSPRSRSERGKEARAVVAMVGDGINDSPALSMADVGIAIGSGSDVAISSAKFVLLTSNLTSLLTLIDLSRLVFRRVKFNFFWALIYNLVALPIAAGVLYPIRSRGSHIRLDPVWASLAMALSSVSVVCSSLLLRSSLPGIGFRRRQENA